MSYDFLIITVQSLDTNLGKLCKFAKLYKNVYVWKNVPSVI